MTQSVNYPSSATKVVFRPFGDNKNHIYHVWKSGSRFMWYSQGNSGVTDTLEMAMSQAREWILYGINGLQSHGHLKLVRDYESGKQSN